MATRKVPLTSASLAGLQFLSGRLITVLVWGLAYLVVYGAILALGMGLAAALGYDWAEALAALFSEDRSPGYSLLDLLSMPASLVSGALINTAIYRAKFAPDSTKAFHLRVGGDEKRMLLCNLALLGLLVGAAFVGSMIATFLSMFVRVLSPVGGGLTQALLILATISFCGWLGLRLSMAAPMTFVTGRVVIGGSLDVTQGHAGRLLGMMAVTFLIAFALVIAAVIVFMVLLVLLGALLGLIGAGDFESLSPSSPISLVVAALGLPLVAFFLGAITTVVVVPPAEAYLRLTGGRAGTPEQQAEVFS